MALLDKIFGRGEKKTALSSGAISFLKSQDAQMTPRRYDTMCKEGYVLNQVVYRCVKMIADGAASAEWKVYDRNGKELKNHPALDLIAKPNMKNSRKHFIEGIVSYYLLNGNAYIEKTQFNNRGNPVNLFTHRPDRMEIEATKKGRVTAFVHSHNGAKTTFPVDTLGRSNICHLKSFHPLNELYGMAALEAAALATDQHNNANKHNLALLQNGAAPSAAFLYNKRPTDEIMDRIEEEVNSKYSGANNAGRPLILAGGDVKYQALGMTPRELDFMESQRENARAICNAFGTPHELIITGSSTYNNKAEAKLSLWEETIIPILDMLRDEFFPWVAEAFAGSNIRFDYDLNDITALIPRRSERKDRIIKDWTSGVITRNEARDMLGYDMDAKLGDSYFGEVAVEESSSGSGSKSFEPHQYKALTDIVTVDNELDRTTLLATVTGLVESELQDLVAKHGQFVIEEIGEQSVFQITAALKSHIQSSTATAIRQINSTTRQRIKSAISEGLLSRQSLEEIEASISDLFEGEAAKSRIRMIAATESTKATGYASLTAIKQSGLQKMEWLSTIDGSTRDSHASMDGQISDVEGLFQSPNGGKAKHPGGFGIAEEDINCRCAIAASFDEEERSDNPVDRAKMWEKREEKRQDIENDLIVIFEKMFTIQKTAILKRMKEVTGDAN